MARTMPMPPPGVLRSGRRPGRGPAPRINVQIDDFWTWIGAVRLNSRIKLEISGSLPALAKARELMAPKTTALRQDFHLGVQ